MNYQSTIFLFLTFFILYSCATESRLVVPYQTPTVIMQSPETSGDRWNGEISSSIISSQKVTLLEAFQTRDYFKDTYNLNVSSTPKVKRETTFAFNGSLGLFKNLDLITFLPWGSAYRFGLKYQLMGATQNEFTKGFKLAIVADYGIAKRRENPYTNGIHILDDKDQRFFEQVRAKLNQDVFDIATIVGYRANQTIIYYTTLYYQQVYNKLTFYRQSRNAQILKSHYTSSGLLLGLKSFLSKEEESY
ncbi:MAG: hypothetical protein U0T83_02955 [Bacteriovoracaceae bacterium]